MAKVYQDTRSRKTGALRPWCISYVGLDGKRHRDKTTAATKAEAEAILRKKMSEVTKAKLTDAHTLEAAKPKPFKEFLIKEYLPHCQATHTPSTYYGDRSCAKSSLPYFGALSLRSITPGTIQRFIDQQAGREIGPAKKKRKIRPATVNRLFMFVSGVLAEAVRRGYIDRNPASRIPQLPEHNDKLRWLTDAEEERLLAFAPDYIKPLILTAIHTGMRKGEVLRLKRADLDFEQRLLQVTQAKNHRVRYIPMNDTLMELLRSIPAFVGKNGPSPYVFTNPETGVGFTNIDHGYREAVRKAGLTGVNFHTLRHTFASRLVQAGVPLNTVRELLGHGTMQVTMRYAHLAPNNLHEAVAVLAKKGSAGSPAKDKKLVVLKHAGRLQRHTVKRLASR
jgi:integrase